MAYYCIIIKSVSCHSCLEITVLVFFNDKRFIFNLKTRSNSRRYFSVVTRRSGAADSKQPTSNGVTRDAADDVTGMPVVVCDVTCQSAVVWFGHYLFVIVEVK